MVDSQRPAGDDIEPQSRRLTPSIGLSPDSTHSTSSEVSADSSNEDFLFHLYRGSELLQDNRVHEAKEELERALRLQPRDTQGQDLLAVVYFRLGLYPRAIAIFEQLRSKNKRDTALLLNLALCYLKTGKPAMARAALEQLVEINPGHARAWGYLGLSCERTGDLTAAEHAFRQGGHAQMAARIAGRRASTPEMPSPVVEEPSPTRDVAEVRNLVATTFEELDAGELSFELAREAAASPDEAGAWRSIELGSPSSPRHETEKPDTRDGPPPVARPAVPQLAIPLSSRTRRPTLVVGAAPQADAVPAASVPGFDNIPSPRPPSFALDDRGVPSLRHQVVAVPPVRDGRLDTPAEPIQRTKTLPPPLHRPPTAPPPPVSELAAQSSITFPGERGIVIHPSGVALVSTAVDGPGFAARLESMRVSSNGLTMKPLERQVKGKTTGESFGGVGSPVVQATGEGQLVLAARTGRKLSSFVLEDDMCFVREEVLLGFDGHLGYENGRLAAGEGEFVAVVQLRGTGAVLLEGIGEVLTLDVKANRGMSVRREVILGWFGRIVPRALAPSEAPCGQRGLVSFAGEGRVLVASA